MTLKEFGDSIIESVKGHVARAIAQLEERFDAAIKAIPAGAKGDKGDPGEPGVAVHGKDGLSAYQLSVERGYRGTELEWLDAVRGAPGAPGKDAKALTTEDVRPLIQETVEKAVAAIPRPKDGESIKGEKGDPGESIKGEKGDPGLSIKGDKGDPGESIRGDKGDAGTSVSLDDVRPVIQTLVEKAVSEIPRPKDGESIRGEPGRDGNDGESIQGQPGKDGTSVTLEDVAPLIQRAVGEAVAAIPPALAGKDGTSITVEDVRPMMKELVDAEVKALPPAVNGKDGSSVTAKDIEPMVAELVQRAVSAIPPAVPGKDGKDGESIHPDSIALMVKRETEAAFEKLVLPKDGRDGEPGRDAAAIHVLDSIDETRSYPRGTFARHRKGFWHAEFQTQGMKGWECIAPGLSGFAKQVDERSIAIVLESSDGERSETILKMPVMIYRDVYRPEVVYQKGDTVTWAGDLFIALQDEPSKKPGDISDGKNGEPQQWQKAVKRGNEGKSAYESAKRAGFVGTEAEWVASLKKSK